MRLYLNIQRQGLPDVKVLWTTDGLRVSQKSTTSTIAQLLEQINDTIPLEAEDWDLNDYAVEVRGFECLHFVPLEQILKEDDHVMYILSLKLSYQTLS